MKTKQSGRREDAAVLDRGLLVRLAQKTATRGVDILR